MELKYDDALRAKGSKQGFNRTFMELKSNIATSNEQQVMVLIVPLWNWNCKIELYSTPVNLGIVAN